MSKVFVVVLLGVLCCSSHLEAGTPSEEFERAKFMLKSKRIKSGRKLLKRLVIVFKRSAMNLEQQLVGKEDVVG